MDGNRIERDSLGPVRVPSDALYGPQTARAVENFPVSGLRFPRRFIRALGIVKQACARANFDTGGLRPEMAGAIVEAAGEVAAGRWDEQFVVDVFQTGSGTSTNMNANEVIARRAEQILGSSPGTGRVHPNDHVNLSQSSNDVIPTAIHVAAATAIEEDLVPSLDKLRGALRAKSREFDGIVKSGRTHLMDATPIRLGQEFSGYAAQVDHGIARAARARDALMELALGGTAVGTGLNRKPEFPGRAIASIAAETGLPFREAANHFEAQAARDACVEVSGELKTIATSLMKIANDIRLMGSGPRAGLGEIVLPAVQPGSSIMPGKVNPVMPEMVTMVAAQVIGHDAAITVCGAAGAFELNAMMPLLAHDLLDSIALLSSASRIFAERCVMGIVADAKRCGESIERNLSICTALVPRIGYDRASEIANEAFATNRTIREVAKEKGVLPDEEIDGLLDALGMTEPDD
jgi:fumarate hydratase class II